MTLNELKQQETLFNEEYEQLLIDKEGIKKLAPSISEWNFTEMKNNILDKMIANREQKIECLKAQIKLLTN